MHLYFNNHEKCQVYVKEILKKLNNLFIESQLEIFDVKIINVMMFGKPSSGKSASITTLYSTLREKFIQIAPTSNSQKSYTKAISHIFMNANKKISFWDVFGFTDKNYDQILNLAIAGQLKEGFKEGENIEIDKLITQPNINDQVHAVVIIVDATDLFSELNKSLYKEYIKRFQDKGIYIIYSICSIYEFILLF